MEYLSFEGRKIRIADINIILINEQRSCVGPLGYFLTVFTKSNSYNSHGFEDRSSIKLRMKRLCENLKQEDINNFAFLNDEFILNIDNVKTVDWLSNAAGSQLIEAYFKNGDEFDLYEGFNRKYARHLYNSYNEQENAYLGVLEL